MQWGAREADATATGIVVASIAALAWVGANVARHGGSAFEVDDKPPSGVVDQIATFGIAMAGLVIVTKATMSLLEIEPCRS